MLNLGDKCQVNGGTEKHNSDFKVVWCSEIFYCSPFLLQQLDKNAGINQIKVIAQTDASGQQNAAAKALKRPATSDGHAVPL